MIGTIETCNLGVHARGGGPVVFLTMKLSYLDPHTGALEHTYNGETCFTPEAYCEAMQHVYTPQDRAAGLFPRALEGKAVEFEFGDERYRGTFVLASMRRVL